MCIRDRPRATWAAISAKRYKFRLPQVATIAVDMARPEMVVSLAALVVVVEAASLQALAVAAADAALAEAATAVATPAVVVMLVVAA